MRYDIKWFILEEILRTLKQDMTFVPASPRDASRVNPKDIVFQKVANPERDINQGQTQQNFPNIIVTVPAYEPFNFEAGEVNHDEYVFRFLIQILDSDNFEPIEGVRTYWSWQQMTNEFFQAKRDWGADVDSASSRVFCVTRGVNTVDPRYWIANEKFKCGVELAIKVWRTRVAGP